MVKNLPANVGDARDAGSIAWLEDLLEKEIQKKGDLCICMAVWGGLTNRCEKERSEKQRSKGKI